MNRKKQKNDYPNLPFAIRPVTHGEHLPLPKPPKKFRFEFGDGRGRHGENRILQRSYISRFQRSPHKLTQNELNDLVRDLELPKVKVELLASTMKQWKYMDEGVKLNLYRYRQKKILKDSSPWRAL
jgi:hypothetical protein